MLLFFFFIVCFRVFVRRFIYRWVADNAVDFSVTLSEELRIPGSLDCTTPYRLQTSQKVILKCVLKVEKVDMFHDETIGMFDKEYDVIVVGAGHAGSGLQLLQ
jgi:hypothetical protein